MVDVRYNEDLLQNLEGQHEHSTQEQDLHSSFEQDQTGNKSYKGDASFLKKHINIQYLKAKGQPDIASTQIQANESNLKYYRGSLDHL